MNDLRPIDQLRSSELRVTRNNFWFPYYELSDGQFIYGRLSFKGAWKRYAIIETADGTWTIKREGIFSRNMLLNLGEDETIAVLEPALWRRDITLKMTNGFQAMYLTRKLFSATVTVTTEKFGDLLNIRQKAFGFKTPMTVEIEPSLISSRQTGLPSLALLSLIGINIILLRQRRAAAGAAAS